MTPDFLDLMAFSQLFEDEVRLGLLPKRLVEANGIVATEKRPLGPT